MRRKRKIRSKQQKETNVNYRTTTHETEIRVFVFAPSTVALAVTHVTQFDTLVLGRTRDLILPVTAVWGLCVGVSQGLE